MSDAAAIRRGYKQAQAVTRHHAKSFYFASFLLFGRRRRAAFALYAFCRRLDDLVDDGPATDLAERLSAARRQVAEVYLPFPALASRELGPPEPRSEGASAGSPWRAEEFAALRDAIAHYRIPEQPFQDLISGMEMDLTKARYETFQELDLYCYRVAGVVGLKLTPVLGSRDPEAASPAADLGRAMQLTNILRDVKEDLARGRIYLPAQELASFGITEEDLRAGRVDERFADFMRFQVARARGYYARAAAGVPLLRGFGCQKMVRLMGAIYGGILGAIERQGYDVFRGRAHVDGREKLRLAAGVLLTGSRPELVALAPGGELAP